MVSEGPHKKWSFEVRPDNRLLKTAALLLSFLTWMQAMISFMDKEGAPRAFNEDLVIAGVLVTWGLIGAALICAAFWLAFGRQVIATLDDRFTVTKFVGRWRISNVQYQVADVKNVRIEERRRSFKGKSELLYSVKFDYLGEQRSFLESVSRKAAQAFLANIKYEFNFDR